MLIRSIDLISWIACRAVRGIACGTILPTIEASILRRIKVLVRRAARHAELRSRIEAIARFTSTARNPSNTFTAIRIGAARHGIRVKCEPRLARRTICRTRTRQAILLRTATPCQRIVVFLVHINEFIRLAFINRFIDRTGEKNHRTRIHVVVREDCTIGWTCRRRRGILYEEKNNYYEIINTDINSITFFQERIQEWNPKWITKSIYSKEVNRLLWRDGNKPMDLIIPAFPPNYNDGW